MKKTPNQPILLNRDVSNELKYRLINDNLTNVIRTENSTICIFKPSAKIVLENNVRLPYWIVDTPIQLNSHLVKALHTDSEWENIRKCKTVGIREAEFYAREQLEAYTFYDILYLHESLDNRDVRLMNIHQTREEWKLITMLGIKKTQLQSE